MRDTGFSALASKIIFALCAAGALMAAVPSRSAPVETVVVTGYRDAADPCLVVAGAKAAQWTQSRFMIHEARALFDGSEKQAEIIYTADYAYAHWVGRAWNSMALGVEQRRLVSADAAVQRMQLDNCRMVGTAQKNGAPVHVYAYSYLSDDADTARSGRIWISDATQLPVRQQLDVPPPHTRPQDVTRISANYVYGDDVHVPGGAQLVQMDRRIRTQQWVRDMQAGRNGMGP